MRITANVFACSDCDKWLAVRAGGPFGGGYDRDWFMCKDHVWRQGQCEGAARFLCVHCLEDRIGRKLEAADFRRTAKVNFTGTKSLVLRRRMHGLKPAKRLIETTFTP